jgi:hypothetical protein
MQSLSSVKRLQQLKDRLPSLCPAHKGLPFDALGFQSAKEALHQCVVVPVPFAAHTHHDTRPGRQLAVAVDRLPRAAWCSQPGSGCRRASAIRAACSSSVSSRCASMAQPTTRREKMSSTTARYSQPSIVQIAVISATHARMGRRCRQLALEQVGCHRLRMLAVGGSDAMRVHRACRSESHATGTRRYHLSASPRPTGYLHEDTLLQGRRVANPGVARLPARQQPSSVREAACLGWLQGHTAASRSLRSDSQ